MNLPSGKAFSFKCALSQGNRVYLHKEALFGQRQFFQIFTELSAAKAPSSWRKDISLQEWSSIALRHTSQCTCLLPYSVSLVDIILRGASSEMWFSFLGVTSRGQSVKQTRPCNSHSLSLLFCSFWISVTGGCPGGRPRILSLERSGSLTSPSASAIFIYQNGTE